MDPDQRAVIELAADGLTNDEMVARLGISVHTVRSHVKHAMSKLGARSKLEAVVIALRAGLISLSEASRE